MALLFIDGFDHFNTEALMLTKGYSGSLSLIGSSYARWASGSNGIRMTSTSQLTKDFGVNKTEMWMGIGIKKSAAGAPTIHTNYPLIVFYDEGSTKQVQLNANANYGFNVYRGTTLIDTTDNSIIPNQTWFWLEVRAKIHATLGEVEIRINEQVVYNGSNLNTKEGTDYIRKIRFSTMYNALETFYDDYYIDDAQFHGNCRVRTYLPDSDSVTHTDFVRSGGAADYECVDDNPPNDDTDYIASETLNAKSAFGITTGALAETIKCLQITNRVRATTAGVRRIKPLIRSGGSDYKGPLHGVVPVTYKFQHRIWENDPQDSQPWNQTKLEAGEFGLELLPGTTTTTTTTSTTSTTTS